MKGPLNKHFPGGGGGSNNVHQRKPSGRPNQISGLIQSSNSGVIVRSGRISNPVRSYFYGIQLVYY